jgi:hypothetical protein
MTATISVRITTAVPSSGLDPESVLLPRNDPDFHQDNAFVRMIEKRQNDKEVPK